MYSGERRAYFELGSHVNFYYFSTLSLHVSQEFVRNRRDATQDGRAEPRGQLLSWQSMGGMCFMYRNAGVSLVLK